MHRIGVFVCWCGSTPPFLERENYDLDTYLDDVSDWLSDEYGWCHFGFEAVTEDGTIKVDTMPD